MVVTHKGEGEEYDAFTFMMEYQDLLLRMGLLIKMKKEYYGSATPKV